LRECKGCLKQLETSEFTVVARQNDVVYFRRICNLCFNKKRREIWTVSPAVAEADRVRSREYWRNKNGWHGKSRKATIKERVAFIAAAKDKPCMDCGNRFPSVAMDFDHVRGEKTMGIAYMAQHGYSLDLIRQEIEKCDVVCSNCHRIRTWLSRTSGHLKGIEVDL
jgi:hypothetical protein